MSETYQPLMHARIRSACKQLCFNNHPNPWGEGTWPNSEEIHYFDIPSFEGENVWHRIRNTQEGITLEIGFWEWNESACVDKNYISKFTFKHRTANPAKDYKYLFITKPTTLQFGHVIYHTNSTEEEILFKEEPWGFAKANM